MTASSVDPEHLKCKRGFENQRRADNGDGTFLNPIPACDHPDPTTLRDGDRWLMTFSSLESHPGRVIWQSRDLVNWTPLTAALKTNIGSVWAPELTRHNDRYFLFVPARFPDKCSIYVIHAEKPEGRWPGPINLNLPWPHRPRPCRRRRRLALVLFLRRRSYPAQRRRPIHHRRR